MASKKEWLEYFRLTNGREPTMEEFQQAMASGEIRSPEIEQEVMETLEGLFCSNCGAKIENGVKFCSSCGAEVSTIVEPVEPANKKEVTATPPNEVETANSMEDVARKKHAIFSSNHLALVGCLTVIAAVVLSIAFEMWLPTTMFMLNVHAFLPETGGIISILLTVLSLFAFLGLVKQKGKAWKIILLIVGLFFVLSGLFIMIPNRYGLDFSFLDFYPKAKLMTILQFLGGLLFIASFILNRSEKRLQ